MRMRTESRLPISLWKIGSCPCPRRNELWISRRIGLEIAGGRVRVIGDEGDRPVEGLCPWSSQSRILATMVWACSTVVAGSRPRARSGGRRH
jgi:hypothetical protein